MRIKKMKWVSLILSFVVIFNSITVFAKTEQSKTIIPAIDGVRSEMVIAEYENTRVAYTTDGDGNYLEVICNKEKKEFQIYCNGELLNENSAVSKRVPELPNYEKVIGNYSRTCLFHTYATLDIEQTILWQGNIKRISYVWRITGDTADKKKDIVTSNYTMPDGFRDMVNAVNDLRDQETKIIALGAGAGILSQTILTAAAAGVAAIELLFASAGLGTDIVFLLYDATGLQVKEDVCRGIYETYRQ